MTPDPERLRRLLGSEEMASLRQRLRSRYERGAAGDVFTLNGLSAIERSALEGLLGRPIRTAGSMRISQRELDSVFARAGLALNLRLALESIDGPIEDRRAARIDSERAWHGIVSEEQDARLRALLEDADGLGLLKRLAGGSPSQAQLLLGAARRVLSRLPHPGIPLARLAAEALGDAHALDAGCPIATLVLRAAGVFPSVLLGAPGVFHQTRVRNRWARLGVSVHELSAPVLCLNLRAQEDTPAAGLIMRARELGEPVHLSLRALLRHPPAWLLHGETVFVCENPEVIAIAADRFGVRCAPMVCTDGMPAAAQRTLLRQLARSAATLRYHGDFDWPGLRIGNFVMREFGASAWRFGSQDYLAAAPVSGRRLHPVEVAAEWDADLGPAMRRLGFAVDEEAVVEVLLAELAIATRDA